MTAEQLQATRSVHWRQNRNPILTLEDAAEWFSRHPLSLFLPRPTQLPAPAPSFVEACIGAANATPPQAAVEQAKGLLAQLTTSNSVLALNLLGIPGLPGIPGEQPDFIAHREVLPLLISLRGERDWKHAPGSSAIHKASPLVVEVWKALGQGGAMTAAGMREKLGRELTESAALRALSELWQSLRAIPILQPEGRPALWELLEAHHRNAVAQGSGTSQVTAISLLVSAYLQSVYAASGEEIEVFLSPLASRSRIREAVRGLSATRQIHSLSMETQTYYFLEGGLPEFAEAERKQKSVSSLRRAPEDAAPHTAAKSVPLPKQPAPAPNRSGSPAFRYPAAADRATLPAAASRNGGQTNKNDWQRRKDSGAAHGEHPPARTKERWRKPPGKPVYRPDQARPQGAAPPARRPVPGGAPAERGLSRPAMTPFSPAGGRRSPDASRGEKIARTGRPKPVGPAFGKAGGGRFRTGRPFGTGRPPFGAGKPMSGKAGAGPPKAGAGQGATGRPGAGRPGTTATGRLPSAWKNKAGRSSSGTRPFVGSRTDAARARGGFPKRHPGSSRTAEGARGFSGSQRFSGTRPGGIQRIERIGRPAAGKGNFSGGEPRSGRGRGRKKP